MKFKIYEENGKRIIERLIPPCFKGEITSEKEVNIENIELLDDCADEATLERAKKKAVEFIKKGRQIKKNNDNKRTI